MINKSKRLPRVSIGLAVYNGENYIKRALESILTQTFDDFELIISNNASTDKTEEICLAYAERDQRIRYHCNETNIGGANNENLAFRMSCGEYFRLAAHDDYLSPTLLEKSVDILDKNPDVVLCHSITTEVDGLENPIRVLDRNKATSSKPYKRFYDLTKFDHNCEEMYGLIRSEILRKTNLQLNYTDSDRTLLCELSLYGKFYQIPEPLFFRRIHPEMSTRVFPEWRSRMAWFGFEIQNQILCPHWMQFFHYLRIITRSPILFHERLYCYWHILFRWIIIEKHGRSMMKDLILATSRLPRLVVNKLKLSNL